jgi:uncharacterized phage infection (PIP) family protein YhgE
MAFCIAKATQRLDALQDNLDKEDRAYTTRAAKLKDKYDDEVKNAQSAYDKKRDKLQESLNQEQTILQAHAADVARIGEQQKADDITRLERKFAEENSKAQTHYNDQVEKIRDAANRQGVAQISGFGAGAMAQSPALSQQFNRIGTDMGNKMSDGIKKGVHDGLRSLGDIGNSIQGSSPASITPQGGLRPESHRLRHHRGPVGHRRFPGLR